MIWNATKFMQFSCHLFWTKYYVYVSSYFKIQKWSEMQPIHTNFMSLVLKLYVYIYIYHDSLRYKNLLGNATHSCKFHVIGSEIIYIYVCVCSHLISPCCSPCWWVFLRFSISSPGDFISFPHLFDHFIKRIWSVLISLSQKMFPTYFFILLFGSSAVPSFPNLFLQLIITVWLQFSKVFPTYWCMLSLGFISFSHLKHFVSSSWCFMSFGCPFLHCIIRFHQSSSPKSSLYHSFSSVFSHLLVIFITSH